jgi:hypothetical protein
MNLLDWALRELWKEKANIDFTDNGFLLSCGDFKFVGFDCMSFGLDKQLAAAVLALNQHKGLHGLGK